MGLGRLSGVAVLAAVVLVGCGNTQAESARQAADTFASSVADRDGVAACGLLTRVTRAELEQSSGEPCDRAVLEKNLPSVRELDDVRVFGTMAQATSDADTLFLTRFGDRWYVTAVGCSRGESGVYDCAIQGS